MTRSVLFSDLLAALIPPLLLLNACGGGNPQPVITASYSVTATPLNPVSITAGENATSAITVAPAGGYTGSVTLSCASLSGTASPKCSFSSNPVTVSGSSSASAKLTVSTSIDTPGGSYAISLTAKDASGLAPSNGNQSLALTSAAVIQHIIVIFQENRTPDNLFQDPVLMSRGADIGASGFNSQGQTIELSPIDLGTAGTNPQNFDLSHANSAFVSMYDGGKMDGADLIPCISSANCPANPQFMFVKPSDVQPYFAMAEQYTFGDRMFQTNEGPSFPAHQFIISGTSAPTSTSNLFAAENPSASPAGCIAPSTELVTMIDPGGSESSTQYPCFDHPTLTDFLDVAGVSWRYYTPSAGSIWTGPDAISHICQAESISGILTCTGPDWTNNVIIPEWQILGDIPSGNLAQVSWVIPDGTHSDHPASNDGSGPSWVGSIVNAVGNSPYWANTVIIVTWDDWGGWYDHVAPKVINDGISWGSGYVYGFRVPLIVISPYARAAHISHVTHDFGSVLKFIETTFQLPSLGYADASADDLSDCFQLTQSPIQFQTIPIPLDSANFMYRKEPPVDPDDD